MRALRAIKPTLRFFSSSRLELHPNWGITDVNELKKYVTVTRASGQPTTLKVDLSSVLNGPVDLVRPIYLTVYVSKTNGTIPLPTIIAGEGEVKWLGAETTRADAIVNSNVQITHEHQGLCVESKGVFTIQFAPGVLVDAVYRLETHQAKPHSWDSFRLSAVTRDRSNPRYSDISDPQERRTMTGISSRKN